MENVRIENFLGGNKVIVGNKDSNLVLETLGKVYIKTGKQTRILTDILKLLDSAPTKKLESMIIIVNGVTEMENIEYPGDGFFIFNNVDQSLYISYDNRYIMLVEASQGDGDDMYVKRTGDSMSGQLELTTDNAPLIVASSKLINNLNANFIEGYSAKELAKKRVNETIYGDWTFNGNNVATDNWTFKENIKLNKDLVTDGSISTPMFASGFAGYGWRIDAETNMLTIDYLVVRKAMHVYEMVINKITATNGSLWVTNACKVETSYIPIVINPEEYKDVDGSGIPEYPSEVMNDLVDSDTCYMFLVPENKTSNGYYKYIVHVKDSTILSNNPVYRLGSKQIFEAKYPTMSSDNVSGFWVLTDEQFLTKELTPGDFSEVVSEDQIAEFNANVKLYYIYDKEFVATTPYTRITDITIYEETGEGIETFNVYDHYFAVNSNDKVKYFDNFYVVITENDAYPTLKANDIIRCQKWDSGEIKYYDAIVTNYPADYMYVIQKGPSVFDMYTDIRYDETGKVIMEDKYNNALYETTDYDTEPEDIPANKEDLKLGGIAKGDSLVQVGSTYNTQRQHAIYLTSTDDCAPYMTVISDLNRPDYSVLHQIPKYVKGDDGTDINYEWVVVLDDEGKPVIGEDGGALLKKKYLWKYTDTCKVRIGNLNGIRDDRFPDDRQPYGFGFYGQNVFLTGEFYLNNGQSVVDFSRDGIFLKYKRAGLELVDMKDKENNPIYLTNPDGSYLYENGKLVPKQTINLSADEIHLNAERTYIGDGTDEGSSLFMTINGQSYIKTDLIKAQTLIASEAYNYSFDTNKEYIVINSGSVKNVSPKLSVVEIPKKYDHSARELLPFASISNWVGTSIESLAKVIDYSINTGIWEIQSSGEDAKYPTYLMSPIQTDIGGYVEVSLRFNSIAPVNNDWEAFIVNIDNGAAESLVKSISGGVITFKYEKDFELVKNWFILLKVKTSKDGFWSMQMTELNFKKGKYTLMWGLFKDGRGSLGKENFTWDKDGNISLIGSFTTGGIDSSKSMSMFHDKQGDPTFQFIYNKKVAIDMSYGLYGTGESTYSSPYIRLNEGSSNRLEITSRYIEMFITNARGYISPNLLSVEYTGGYRSIGTLGPDYLDLSDPNLLSFGIYTHIVIRNRTYLTRGSLRIGDSLWSTDGTIDGDDWNGTDGNGNATNKTIAGNPFGMPEDGKSRWYSLNRFVAWGTWFGHQKRELKMSCLQTELVGSITYIHQDNGWK